MTDSDTAERVDATLFAERLARLCVRPRPHLPRNARDRAILLKSAVMALDTGTVYSEMEVNLALQDWGRMVAPDLGADHVAIRRALVDEGLVGRSADGSAYTVLNGAPRAPFRFDAAIAGLDSAAIVAQQRAEIAAQRADYLQRTRAKRSR